MFLGNSLIISYPDVNTNGCPNEGILLNYFKKISFYLSINFLLQCYLKCSFCRSYSSNTFTYTSVYLPPNWLLLNKFFSETWMSVPPSPTRTTLFYKVGFLGKNIRWIQEWIHTLRSEQFKSSEIRYLKSVADTLLTGRILKTLIIPNVMLNVALDIP